MRASLTITAALAILVGAVIGVGAYTFIYAKGYSYLLNDPNACQNCHVMRDQFDGWVKSSHHAAATCNDCHTPHNLVGKYTTKGLNGFWHSFYFTSGRYPSNIQITERNHRVTEQACRHCHAEMTHAVDTTPGTKNELSCIRCHGGVGHSNAGGVPMASTELQNSENSHDSSSK